MGKLRHFKALGYEGFHISFRLLKIDRLDDVADKFGRYLTTNIYQNNVEAIRELALKQE